MDQQPTGPSILLGTLAGYAVSAVVGVAITVALSLHAGAASATGGLKVLAGLGALGAYFGYHITVRRRRSRGVTGPLDEWAKFVGSATFAVIAVVVIAGSCGLAVLIKIVLDPVLEGG
jgi:hypothetical protein